MALKKLEKKAMRTMVVETGERVDGRAADEIRPIMVKDNYLPRVHGSGLFQRGETQILGVTTLNMLKMEQQIRRAVRSAVQALHAQLQCRRTPLARPAASAPRSVVRSATAPSLRGSRAGAAEP